MLRCSRRPIVVVVVAAGVGLLSLAGCRNPGQSTLPPLAVSTGPQVLPPLPKGDVFADETVPTADAQIETGDTLEVVIRRGVGEEKYSSLVRENGSVSVGFMEVPVGGVTVAEAERRVEAAARPFMKEPRAQVTLKKKLLKIKRVFVFGDVKKPGMIPMARHMTVLQALAAADNYGETALLEEIRVVRGGDLNNPRIHLLSISGSHLGLVAIVAFWLVRRLVRGLPAALLLSISRTVTPSKIAILFAWPTVALYALLAGAELATMRSLVMITLAMIATWLGYERHLGHAMAVALLAILLHDPRAIFDISFQLSFLSVLAMVRMIIITPSSANADAAGGDRHLSV
jgi:ComEC/Rec2-related protein